MVPAELKGSDLDENFAEIRDICSYYCNGHDKMRPQLAAFLITLPFTVIYHFNSLVTTLLYFSFGIPRSDTRFPSPVTLGLFVSNILIASFWFWGGKVGWILTTIAAIFNQNFYNSLLFKRNLRDFMLSFVFGNILVIQNKKSEKVDASSKTDATAVKLSERALINDDVEAGNTETSRQEMKIFKRNGKTPVARTSHDFSISSSANSLVEKGSKENSADESIKSRVRISVEDNQEDVLPQNTDQQISHFTGDDSISRHNLMHIATVLAQSNERDDTTRSQRSVQNLIKPQKTTTELPTHRESQPSISTPPTEFLNPYDIYLDLENHPGTITFRNVISDSIDKFPLKKYTFRKHLWVMRKLQGRLFFIQEECQRRRKLSRAEIKEKCKLLHNKQVGLRSQIAGILSDLQYLKKSHTSSKSNSDHSRNSKSIRNIPLEISETLSANLNDEIIEDHPRNEPTSRAKQPSNFDASSIAKDSHVDSHVDSSKESTISSLTQSNGAFPDQQPKARSTPWIQGSADILREPNESTLAAAAGCGGDSTHIRDAINGLLEYTSWLENLNPLREEPIPTQPKEDQGNATAIQQQVSGVPSEVIDDVYTGGFEGGKDPYWRSLVDGPTKKTSKSKDPSTTHRNLLIESNEAIPPQTIHWDADNREFIDTTDFNSRKRPKAFPLWRRALRKSNRQNETDKPCEKNDIAFKANNRMPSVWRRKKSTNNIVSDNFYEKEYEGRDDNDQNYRSDGLSPTVQGPSSLYGQILNSMNEEHLRQWEAESNSMNQSRSVQSSSQNQIYASDKNSSLKQQNNLPAEFCAQNCNDARCDPLEGVIGVCGLEPVSSDQNDEDDIRSPEVRLRKGDIRSSVINPQTYHNE